MIKYLYKTYIFLLPLLCLFMITKIFYNTDKSKGGDLLRLGFLFDDGTYRNEINDRFKKLPIKYKELSTVNLENENIFDILTIGDSFSEQYEYGYKNYLANQEGTSLLHVDRFLSENPVQSLINMTNGDFFEHVKVNYVVLQSIEREIVKRAQKISWNQQLLLDSLNIKIEEKKNRIKEEEKYNFFSNSFFKIPLINILYLYQSKPFDSQTYKVTTNSDFFTNKKKDLLFYFDDLNKVSLNNDSLEVMTLNKTLNKLSLKLKSYNIKLIVLPCPDKYDFYYQGISEKKEFLRPLFFDCFGQMDKSYIYINSKECLLDLSQKTKDVYYYDDTHWSPLAADKIANEIFKKMN